MTSREPVRRSANRATLWAPRVLVACLAVGLLSARRAQAFEGTSVPVRLAPPTPAFAPAIRAAPTLPPGALPAFDDSGFRVQSFRADGWPAIAWAESHRGPAERDRAGVERRALALARALAPELGVAPGDLVLGGATELTSPADGHRAASVFTVVAIAQERGGLPVRGGTLMITFVDGRPSAISNALLHPVIDALTPERTAREAEAIALLAARSEQPDAALEGPAMLEIWVPGDAPQDARLAFEVRTQGTSSRLTFHIDATRGSVLAIDDALVFAEGEARLRLVVDATSPAEPKSPVIARSLLAGAGVTDADGELRELTPVEGTYDGPNGNIVDLSGRAIERFMIPLGGPYQVIDIEPRLLDQADPFVAFHRAREYAKTLSPDLAWFQQKVAIRVNVPPRDPARPCNAFWDGRALNFQAGDASCTSTGRVASVVFHEFGHGYHQALVPSGLLDATVGEAAGDFLAALASGDPGIGTGLFLDGRQLRSLDDRRVYPTDLDGNPHRDGQILGSALWQLRSVLAAKLGSAAGTRAVARAFVRGLAQNPRLATAYPAIIAGDDDDANPTNGTPNACEINQVFAAHGLLDGGELAHALARTRAFVALEHEPKGRFALEGDGVVLDVAARNVSACGTFDPSSLRLFFAPGLRGGRFESRPMQVAGGRVSATLTGLAPGDAFRYYFEATADGATFREGSVDSPHVGVVTIPRTVDLAREGFESGWGSFRHGSISSDLMDDWEVGRPLGLALDPDRAVRGRQVVGTDLGSGGGPGGSDGVAKRATYLEWGPISTAGATNVRLELWHHFMLRGSLAISVNGREVWSHAADEAQASGGWRFLSLPVEVPEGEAVRVRFTSRAAVQNLGGGWTLDDIALTGVERVPSGRPPTDGPKPGDSPDAMTGDDSRTLMGGCACFSPSHGERRAGEAVGAVLLAGLAGLVRGRMTRRTRPRQAS